MDPLLRLLHFPFDVVRISRKRKELRRLLQAQFPSGRQLKVALLASSTTREIESFLELFLLQEGLATVFFEAQFGGYYEETVHQPDRLAAFAPDFVIIHTGLSELERIHDLARLDCVWKAVRANTTATIVQSNLPLPPLRPFGNLEGCPVEGRRVHQVLDFNARLSALIGEQIGIKLNDVLYLSSQLGVDNYLDAKLWFSYRLAESLLGAVHLAHNLSLIMRACLGLSKKCLVVDLDNTLWGGVIGEHGAEGIVLGADNPEGEAYGDFQRYLQILRSRGVLLAICSKNDHDRAVGGFSHPDSILKLSDFSATRINWEPKPVNLRAIAQELNLGLDGLVFVDDNPAERESVRSLLGGQVAVPEVGDDVADYARILDRGGYFEPASIGQEDLQRATYYANQRQRDSIRGDYENYDDFLQSLNMEAEIRPFSKLYLERIVQLTHKTNQFNLTTWRCSEEEIVKMVDNPGWVTLAGRLRDRFGDHGLVSAMAGEIVGGTLHLRLWLMSCRVFGRGMEHAMFDALVAICQARGLSALCGYYAQTAKNEIVANFYPTLGFSFSQEAGCFRLPLEQAAKLNHHIHIVTL